MKEYNGYNIHQLGTFPMVEIKAIGSGPVPSPLRGVFTTVTMARKAVDSYLANKEKGPQDGKTKGSGKG